MSVDYAIQLTAVTKSFKVNVEDINKKSKFLKKTSTTQIQNTVLDDISLNVRPGEIVGILGRNGSGKSTLLSIISRILEPDSGTVYTNGKISTILELGMGFHPDMSGRENIYLKGELYGFSKAEIDSRINEIIDYSGIKEYIDNPVRTYSSGMTGRLAFSIMVNVESDIMIVDEILSVGDRAFETKAREHFKKLATKGKTILFVSHQIEFIEQVCTRAIWIEQGKIIKDGPSKIVCADYLNKMNESPEIILDLANAGVAEAQYKLALSYKGEDPTSNNDLFLYWIELAANQGHVKAQVLYGDYLLSIGETESANQYYQYAAIKGDAEARLKVSAGGKGKTKTICNLLNIYAQLSTENCIFEYRYADLLLKTAWCEEDRKLSFEHFNNSAMKGYPNSLHQLAIMYRDGIGVSRNLPKMVEHLEKAADLGFLPSITYLADLYSQGKLLPKNDEKAFKMSLRASELGNVAHMYRVALMYRDGIGTDINTKLSEKWFDTYYYSGLLSHFIWASDYLKSGYVTTETSLLEYYATLENSGIPLIIANIISLKLELGQNTSSEFELLSTLAKANNLDAMKRLANYYYDGIGVNKDYSKSLELYEKCSFLGDNWCKIRYAEMIRDGKGCEQNLSRSIDLLLSLAKQNNIVAISSILNMALTEDAISSESKDIALGLLNNMALSGNVEAIKKIANYYYDGQVVQRNYTEASKWYIRAIKLGDTWSKTRYLDMCREGKCKSDLKLIKEILNVAEE